MDIQEYIFSLRDINVINLDSEFIKGRKFDSFLRIVKDKGFDLVLDIRWYSLYPDYFRQDHFGYSLNQAGIKYFNAGDTKIYSAITELEATFFKKYRTRVNLGNPSTFRKMALERDNALAEPFLKEIVAKKLIDASEGLIRANHATMEQSAFAKWLYIEYLKKNNAYLNLVLEYLGRFKNIVVICYCPVMDPAECHRFWFIEHVQRSL